MTERFERHRQPWRQDEIQKLHMFAGKGMSIMDPDSGGSALHYNETLRKTYTGISDVDTIINGHLNAQTTWDDLRVFTEFHDDLLAWMKAELAAGKSPEEAAKEWTLPGIETSIL